ncbi:alpha/beta hydrolase fold domain-containing protein [Streptomyces sp. NPDC057199]|uniref:alpha/beta hydrolase fold domain-containing protein n=1 Tax=Streptomyces sp. NPDC057199 TaxID=3346047 RepID=UPI003641AE74
MTDITVTTRQVRPPAPASVSEQAQEFLSTESPFDEDLEPDLDDTEGWLRLIETREVPVRAMFATRVPPPDVLARTQVELAGVPSYVLRPHHTPEDNGAPLFLEIHGGGLFMCGGDLAWMMSAEKAADRIGVTWVPDYRNPPLHPYPAALDDCLAVYRRALEERPPSKIIISGGSGGGNLAAALLLRAKDEGLPMPAGLVLLTPELDLTESGDSFRTNLGIDFLKSLMQVNRLYAGGHDLAHPYLSPLFGDLTGFPPTFLQTGTRDLFLSNAVRMHRRLRAAGVETELHVFEAMPHGSFGGHTPEDKELQVEERRFERQHLQI